MLLYFCNTTTLSDIPLSYSIIKNYTIIRVPKILIASVLILLFSLLSLHAQVKKVCVKSIDIEGNKKTRDFTVSCYLNIQEGDSIVLTELMDKLKENERLILNSQLFLDAKLNVSKWEGANVVLKLKVSEVWYIYPIPIFELADRNFNVWWRDFNRDLKRTNIGLLTSWRNMSGNNDFFKFAFQFGFTRKVHLEYLLPTYGKNQRFGYGIDFLYSDNREFAYDVKDNILQFYRDFDSKERQYKRLRFNLKFLYRQSVIDNHCVQLFYKRFTISDSLFHYNPDFLLGRTRQQSLILNYEYEHDKRDIQLYPLNGHYFRVELKKRGLGVFKDINQLWLTSQVSVHKKFSQRWSLSLVGEGRISMIRSKQPFWQQKAMGYEETYVRGYQYYVINGQDYVLSKMDLNFKIADWDIPLFPESKFSMTKNLPLAIHARLHADYGYVWDRYYAEMNPLTNASLFGAGVGLDVILFYYTVIGQIEYTVNKLGEKDVYLRLKYNF